MRSRALASGAMIAALYAALTVALAPISYGPVQFRVSEALTLLPWYLPEAVPGLFAGCVVANFFGGYGAVDMVVGSCATLIAALLTRRAPRLWMAAVPPVVLNMLLVGGMLHVLVGAPLIATAVYVALGEAGACFILGVPLMKLLERRGILSHARPELDVRAALGNN
ncbi:MAG: QueT transporter family protein [Fretibacterium sp.]|nr:QueT transporter family protein [Fretibacterium sp.]